MSKFNTPKVDERVENYMGAPAYKLNDKLALVSILLTSFAEKSYYESDKGVMDRLVKLIEDAKDKEFVAKAAIFARNEFGMRSITHITAAEIAKQVKGATWVKPFLKKVVHRVDDATEILAYYMSKYGKPIRSILKRGLGEGLQKFDKYQLAKYRGEGKAIKLIDLVNLAHPKPGQKNAAALKELVDDVLKSEGTWESKLSKAGKAEDKEAAKKASWTELIQSKKIGYFALLRNLRNILEQAPEVIDEALSILTNRTRIKKELILPFQYLAAYTALDIRGADSFESERNASNKVLKALNKAVELSIDNIPVLHGKTVILSDNSGSMTGDYGGKSVISAMSSTKTSDIANLFAVMYWTRCSDTLIGLFGDRLIYPKLDREQSIFDNFKIIDQEKNRCGGSTERGIFDMFDRLINEEMKIDNIVVFSDSQIGTGCDWFDNRGSRGNDFNKLYEKYRRINPNFNMYSIDLKGYGTSVFSDKVYKLFGWSEKIFDVMKILEYDKNALVKKIEAVQF